MEEWKLEPARGLELPPMERYRNEWREGGLVESVLRLGWWAFLRTTFRVYNRLKVRGREHLPQKPQYVLIANHASHLDALVLGSILPLRQRDHLFPLAAKDVFFERLPVAGFVASAINALPVWRRASRGHALGDLRQRLLTEPCIYILFPEGTRTRDGTMGTFKPGIGRLVAGTAIPVIPCCLSGTFEAMPPQAWLLRPRQITVQVGRPLTFEGIPDERGGWQEIAAALEVNVRGFSSGK
jgi:1-acyl-sn-glycerol-3-phosphate acyltransferase